MQYLTPSATRPGYWRLGEQELSPGDILEVWILGDWYTAQVEYDHVSDEQQLHIRGQCRRQPFTLNMPGRWPAVTTKPSLTQNGLS